MTTCNMSIIFFIFGLTTDTSELLLALKAWKSMLFGLTSILVLSPLFGFICMQVPFKPYEFALGLAVMACVPTSLSSGVTLVIGAYGNGALALLFTVSANILGIITSPLAVKLVLGSTTDAKVDSADLLVKLGVSILMPVLVGKAMREAVKPLRETIPKFKAPLYLINNLQVRENLPLPPDCSCSSGSCWYTMGTIMMVVVVAFTLLVTVAAGPGGNASWHGMKPEPAGRVLVLHGCQPSMKLSPITAMYQNAVITLSMDCIGCMSLWHSLC